MYRIARGNNHECRGCAGAGKHVKKEGSRKRHAGCLPIWSVESDVLADPPLPTIAVGKQALLVKQQLFPSLGGKLEVRTLDNGIDRTSLLAKSAIDAFDHVDVVPGRAAGAIVAARPCLDGDPLSGADRLAQFSGDAALPTVPIPPQCILAAKAWRQRTLFQWIVERWLRRVKIPQH